jgi:hypothetical protein
LSETASTVIKLLAALTSPKACVKYITVAIVLFGSWKYLEPMVSKTNVPAEQLSIIILLVGVGVGSIAGHFLLWCATGLWSVYEGRRNEALLRAQEDEEKEKKRAAEESARSDLLAKIEKSFDYLHFDQKNTLRRLAIQNEKLGMSDPGNSALQKNGYIELLTHVREKDYLVQINPAIREFVACQWNAEIEGKVREFIEQHVFSESLLELLEEGNQESDTPVSERLLLSTSRYSGAVRGEKDEREGSIGYWLWFDDDLWEEFEKQTGKSYVDETFISKERISGPEN